MQTADYLRRQAEACLRIARAGFDLGTAERLRVMASELRAKAEELDELEKDQEAERFERPMMQGNGASRDRSKGSFGRG